MATARTSTRRAFSADQDDIPADGSPLAPRLMCAAQGCKFAGSLSEGGRSWWCAYHYRLEGQDIPRVSNILGQHAGLVDEIVAAMQLLAKAPTDAISHAAQLTVAQRRLATLGYGDLGQRCAKLDHLVLELRTYLGGEVVKVRTVRPKREALL